jgi:ABC-type branched-subunit amino acid transport system ATPase component
LEKKNMPGGEILGDRLVILGEPTSGKTTFINTIIGNVNIRSGTIAYGGKMGYVSQKLWFRRKSVRDNIVMGRELD